MSTPCGRTEIYDFDGGENNEILKQVQHDRLLYGHSERSPRTPNHVITRKDNEQVMNGLEQSDVVIPNTAHQCHPELVSGSQKLRRFRNAFGMTINSSADGGLERTYNSTDEFADEFSKYIKISTRCDAAHIADCWSTKTVTTTDGETYDVSKAKTGRNLNLKDNKSG